MRPGILLIKGWLLYLILRYHLVVTIYRGPTILAITMHGKGWHNHLRMSRRVGIASALRIAKRVHPGIILRVDRVRRGVVL